jgi:hypothetical protein
LPHQPPDQRHLCIDFCCMGSSKGTGPGFCDRRAFQLAAVVPVCVSLAVSVCGWAACDAAGQDQPIPYSISLDADSPFFAASCPAALKTGSLAVAAADSVPGGDISCPGHAHASCCAQQEPQVCTGWLASMQACLLLGLPQPQLHPSVERLHPHTRETAGEDCHGAPPCMVCLL